MNQSINNNVGLEFHTRLIHHIAQIQHTIHTYIHAHTYSTQYIHMYIRSHSLIKHKWILRLYVHLKIVGRHLKVCYHGGIVNWDLDIGLLLFTILSWEKANKRKHVNKTLGLSYCDLPSQRCLSSHPKPGQAPSNLPLLNQEQEKAREQVNKTLGLSYCDLPSQRCLSSHPKSGQAPSNLSPTKTADC